MIFKKLKSIGRIFAISAFSLFAFSGCFEVENDVITPGETFSVVDAYLTGSYSQSINLVIRNEWSRDLPYFYMDYSITCDNGYKDYSSTSFNLSANEQDSETFNVGQDATYCTFTITGIRPSSYNEDDYDNWTGSYSIPVPYSY